MSDIDTAVVDSLKALDPERPIREADMALVGQGNYDDVRDPRATLAARFCCDAKYSCRSAMCYGVILDPRVKV